MKARMFVLIIISVFIGFMIISGCASTGKVKEPLSPDSTLLIGRIRVKVTGFHGDFKVVNGVYTDYIKIYLVNTSTGELIKMKSHGPHGLFYDTDLEPGQYVIAGFSKFIKGSYHWRTVKVNLGYAIPDYTYFYVTDGCVNNLGDIEWATMYSHTRHGVQRSNLVTFDTPFFYYNYDTVARWFRENYRESAWSDMQWINVEIITKE